MLTRTLVEPGNTGCAAMVDARFSNIDLQAAAERTSRRHQPRTSLIVAEWGRLVALKGFPACWYCIETVLIRSANDVGRLAMRARLRRWRGITERWDHFCDGMHVAYHRRWAAIKLSAHVAAIATVAWVLR